MVLVKLALPDGSFRRFQVDNDFEKAGIAIADVYGHGKYKLITTTTTTTSFSSSDGGGKEGGTVDLHCWNRKLSSAPALLRLKVVGVDPYNDPAALVDPFWACGTVALPQPQGIAAAWYWPKALTGNTHPGACRPNGMMSVCAYSGAYPSGYGLNGPSFSGAPSNVLDGDFTGPSVADIPGQYNAEGFTHFQPSGTGSIGNYYNYLKVLPVRETPAAFVANGDTPSKYRSTLVGERSQPGKYEAILGELNVYSEVTMSEGGHCALHRHTFRSGWAKNPPPPTAAFVAPAVAPAPLQASIAVELSAAGLAIPGYAVQLCQGITVTVSADKRTASGSILTPLPVMSDGKVPPATVAPLELFFCIEFSAPMTVQAFWPASINKGSPTTIKLTAAEIAAAGGSVGFLASAATLAEDAPVELRVGCSLKDEATAAGNVNAAGGGGGAGGSSGGGFDATADAAWREWNNALSRIMVNDDGTTSPGAAQSKQVFYSNLYHALKKPNDFTGQVPSSYTPNPKYPGYAFDYGTLWDQYKCLIPLLASVYPEKATFLIQGLCNYAQIHSYYPNGITMENCSTNPADERFKSQANGLAHHSLADACARGLELDWPAVLTTMLKTFSEDEGLQFVKTGVTDLVHMTHTLDLSGAAFATAQVAEKLGDTAARDKMMALVTNAANAFDSKTGLLNSKGTYYEGTLWNYSFRMLPNMAARLQLCPGGKDQLVALLDSFFGFDTKGSPKKPATQLPICPWQHKGAGMEFVDDLHAAGAAAATYEGLNNEPDMETPYAYAYVGRMDRLAEVLFGVKAYMFAPGRGGLAGNNDSGGESGWYVWSSVGIFPVTGQPVYIIGVPSFASITVRLNGETLSIIKKGDGMYVQSGTLNGVALNGKGWLHVAEAKGTLELTMGKTPEAEWGSILPPSFTSVPT